MPIEVKELADVPIVILTFTEPFDPGDLGMGLAAVTRLADQGKHVHVINDLSYLSINFGDMMLGMSAAISGGAGGPGDARTTHYLVGGHELVKLTAEAGRQDQYGKVDIKYFATLDEAIAAARR